MRLLRTFLVLSACLLSAGCNPAFHDLGTPAPLSPPELETRTPEFIAPPYPQVVKFDDRSSMANNSIWSDRHGHLFRDNRAFREGDILTVKISMNDKAAFQNVSERETKAKGGLTAAGTFDIANHNPSASLDASVDLNGKAQRGGSVNRAEKIQLSVAVVVVRASPNGNLVIAGTQEVRVNHELRLLTVEGVVRAIDILPDNTIPYDKIAEARISYGGSNTRPYRRGLFGAYPERNEAPPVSRLDGPVPLGYAPDAGD
ncbi:MAG: flagellar L-ring protein [Alphaproteobacteria bacterium]|nr:MAG: flagellar L-ring protein [Alphaproteobacteria bacterium]